MVKAEALALQGHDCLEEVLATVMPPILDGPAPDQWISPRSWLQPLPERRVLGWVGKEANCRSAAGPCRV